MKSARVTGNPATVEEGSTESMEVCGETEREAMSSEQPMLVWISLLIAGMEVDRLMKHLGIKINWAWVGG